MKFDNLLNRIQIYNVLFNYLGINRELLFNIFKLRFDGLNILKIRFNNSNMSYNFILLELKFEQLELNLSLNFILNQTKKKFICIFELWIKMETHTYFWARILLFLNYLTRFTLFAPLPPYTSSLHARVGHCSHEWIECPSWTFLSPFGWWHPTV